MKLFYLFIFLCTSLLVANDGIIKLSKEEQKFLNTTNIQCISTSTWAPMNMENDRGELSGITIDFWNLIKEKANLNATLIHAQSWNQVLYSIKKKDADITLGTSYGKEKATYAKFSVPYIEFPIAIATLYDKSFIPDASFLENRRVAVGANYSAYSILHDAYPNIDFVQVENTQKALEMLVADEVYAVVDILPVVAHLISKNGYYNAKIAGTSKFSISLSFMIRDDYPILVNILNKYIQMLTPEEKNSITREWLRVKFDKNEVHYDIILQILAFLFLILLFLFIRYKNMKEFKKKIKKLSNKDELTGLPNRARFLKKVKTMKDQLHTIIIIDIDNFKFINSTYGFDYGDKVLIDISKILKKNLEKNEMVARWYGKDFIIVCKNIQLDDTVKKAEKLREAIENCNFEIGAITASFGVSEYEKELNIEQSIYNAEKALLRAKQHGRNQVKYA